MKIMTYGLVIMTALLVVGNVNAADKLGVTYTYSAPSDSDYEDELEQHEIKLEGSIPLMNAEESGTGLAVGGLLQANVWTFDNNAIDDVDLYKLLLTTAVDVPINERYIVAGGGSIGAHSDFKDVDEHDFRIDAHVMGVYISSPTLRFGLGLAIGEEFGEAELFPLFGVYWQATDALLLDLMFPKPKVSYAMSEDLRLFIAAEPTGGDWNVGEGEGQRDFQIRGFRGGLGAEYQIGEGGWLFAMVGAETGREVQIALNDEELLDDDVELDDNAFFQIGYRIQ